jgi:hypothetical protein
MLQSLSTGSPQFNRLIGRSCCEQASSRRDVEFTNGVDLLRMRQYPANKLNLLFNYSTNLNLPRTITCIKQRQVIIILNSCNVLIK